MADQPHIIDDGFSEPEQVRKIFVGNLPYEADEGMGTIFYIYNQLLQHYYAMYQNFQGKIVVKPRTQYIVIRKLFERF